MAKRRFLQINHELVEVTADFVPEVRRHDELLWNDRSYSEIGDPRFTSRTSHREYMKANNLALVDDFHGTWRKAEADRINWRKGIDPSRRTAIEKSIGQLESRKR